MTCIANRPIHESINEGESSLNNGSYQGEKIMERRMLKESTRTKKGAEGLGDILLYLLNSFSETIHNMLYQ